MSQIYQHASIENARKRDVKPVKIVERIEKKTLLDTNVLVRLLTEPDYCYNFMISHQNTKFVVIDKMWQELERVTKIKRRIAEYILQKMLENIQTVTTTTPLEEHALSIQLKTNSKCHWPDSMLVVIAIWFDWTVCTHDSDLLNVCKSHDVKGQYLTSSGLIRSK